MAAVAAVAAVAATPNAGAQPAGGPGDAAPDVTVTAAASARDVSLGAPFSLFVTARGPAGIHAGLPAALPLAPAFEERRRASRTVRVADSGEATRELELELLAWQVGDVAIPPLPVTYAYRGEVHTVYTRPVPIRVISVLGPDDLSGETSAEARAAGGDDSVASEPGALRLRAIAPPAPVYRVSRAAVAVAVGAVLAGVAALVGVGFAARRRRVSEPRTVALPAPASQAALDRLDRLARSDALDAADLRPAMREMSDAVRAYLARRLAISATAQATDELVASVASRVGDARTRARLAAWLGAVDLAKFAGARPSADEAAAALAEARAIIVATAGTDRETEPARAVEAAETADSDPAVEAGEGP